MESARKAETMYADLVFGLINELRGECRKGVGRTGCLRCLSEERGLREGPSLMMGS